MTPLRISAKHLGQLAMPDCCSRCFWLQMRVNWKTPWSIFPAVFGDLDLYTKRVVRAHYAAHDRLPPWLPNLGTPIEIPHWSRFCWRDEESGVLLTGAPDEMCCGKGLAILDFKTARHTDGQDRLRPMYEVQLDSYAWLADRLGMGPTNYLALVYCEPQVGENGDPLEMCRDDGFDLHLAATVEPVEVRPEIVPPLLQRVREICTLAVPPVGCLGCKDCKRLAAIMATCGAIEPLRLDPAPPPCDRHFAP